MAGSDTALLKEAPPVAILGRERRAEARNVRWKLLCALRIAPECHFAVDRPHRTGATETNHSHRGFA
jgi:hypothetical protein